MRKPWFKAKKYGVGWTPVTWQGWLASVLYVLLVVNAFLSVEGQNAGMSALLTTFVPMVVILTLVFGCVAYVTGEKLQWNWGTTPRRSTKKTKRRRK